MCMSAPEVLHRVENKLQAIKEQRFGTGAESVPEAIYVDADTWLAPATFDSQDQWLAAADKVLAGKIDVFNIHDYDLGVEPRWNTDPKTGIHAPLVFGKTMDYRDEAVVGDIKYLWEPSRHLQFVALCMAYKISGQAHYYEAFRKQLISWFDQCPYMMGPQWVSSLEVGIRLLNWSICWQLLGAMEEEPFAGEQDQQFRQRWLESIYQHAHFINGHYSRYSSANNHLIGEASGVFVASVTWPYWEQLADWGNTARQILEAEASAQTYSDGVNKEQAISYQQFVLDFLLLPYLSARETSQPFSKNFETVIESMMEFLSAMVDINGNVPMIGDADDGYAVKLDYSDHFCPYRSLLATGAVLFGRQDFKSKAGAFDDKSLVLLGQQGQEAFTAMAAPAVAPIKTSFPEGGYYLMGEAFNEPGEIRLWMDAGPLGYGGIAAHGHADALSVYLAVKGREILIDPGTYAYHTEKKWRNYFRGTSAHNTVELDGQDQSQIGGNFMWLRKAQSWVEQFSSQDEEPSICAYHDGYDALKDPVRHQRQVKYTLGDKTFHISDIITCNNGHTAKQFWHFSEHCEVELQSASTVKITNDTVSVTMACDPGLNLQLLSGSDELPLGWVSRRFDHKSPSVTLVAEMRVTGTTQLHTKIII